MVVLPNSTRLPLVLGRYELRTVLGSGGTATVYLGRLTGGAGFRRAVAIKRLHPHFASDPALVAMFVDEARLAGSIHHPHVVSVNDVVTHNDELLLVMDFVRGASFSAVADAHHRTGARMDPSIASRVICDALSGLHAAHQTRDSHGLPLSIVHRDVSPQNILVDVTGISRVIDFGIAKAVSRVQNTQQGQRKGKLAYMAPEQIRGQQVGPRTDVYGAAAALWTVLAGRPMYDLIEEAAQIYAILEGNRPPLRSIAPHVSPALEKVIDKALSLDPSERFESAAIAAEAIESCCPVASYRTVATWLENTLPEQLREQAKWQFDVETDVGIASAPLPALTKKPNPLSPDTITSPRAKLISLSSPATRVLSSASCAALSTPTENTATTQLPIPRSSISTPSENQPFSVDPSTTSSAISPEVAVFSDHNNTSVPAKSPASHQHMPVAFNADANTTDTKATALVPPPAIEPPAIEVPGNTTKQRISKSLPVSWVTLVIVLSVGVAIGAAIVVSVRPSGPRSPTAPVASTLAAPASSPVTSANAVKTAFFERSDADAPASHTNQDSPVDADPDMNSNATRGTDAMAYSRSNVAPPSGSKPGSPVGTGVKPRPKKKKDYGF